jgi:hypothetical protein
MVGGDSTGGSTPPPSRREGRLRIGGWVPTFAGSSSDRSTAGLATGDPPTMEPPTMEPPGDDRPGDPSWPAGPGRTDAPPASTDWDRDRDPGSDPDPDYDYQPDPGHHPDPDYDYQPDPGHHPDPDYDYQPDPGHHPDSGAGPAEWDGGAEAGVYQGRRRAGRPAAWSRRVAVAAVAAVTMGVLLVGVGMLGQALQPGPAPLPAPPTPPLLEDPSPEGGPDRLGTAPTGSPASPGASATPTGTGGPAGSASFEAERAQVGSHGQVTSLAGASGGQVVRLNGRADGTFVQFTGVTVAEPGGYRLTVFYFSEQRRTGTVVVNGGSPEPVTFPARGAGGGTGSVSLSVELAGGGGNTIRIATDGGAPVSVDRITIGG